MRALGIGPDMEDVAVSNFSHHAAAVYLHNRASYGYKVASHFN